MIVSTFVDILSRVAPQTTVIPPEKSGAGKWNFLIMRNEEIHMKRSRFSEHQILDILKQAEAGTPVPELCREHGMSSATFYIYGQLPLCKRGD